MWFGVTTRNYPLLKQLYLVQYLVYIFGVVAIVALTALVGVADTDGLARILCYFAIVRCSWCS